MTTNPIFAKTQTQTQPQTPSIENSSPLPDPVPAPKRFILVVCRPTTSDENKILSKNFSNIVLYHSELNSGQLDLSLMNFDLLIIDVSNRSNHVFVEVVSAQAKALNIPIIVLKKSLTNYEELSESLEASVIKTIEDFNKSDFALFLTKDTIPKLEGRVKTCLKGLVALLSKQ